MRFTSKLALGVGIAVGVAVCGAGAAVADPPSGTTPKTTDIVSVGSDTTQTVSNAIAGHYNAAKPTSRYYSWDATGSATINTKSGCASITRPNGSGAGIAALKSGAKTGSKYCIDLARSSRGPAPGDGSTALPLAFVAFAKDAVTWSANSTTNAPSSLTTTQLKSIYSCDASILGTGKTGKVTWNEVGGTSTSAVVPVIPQASSGTRSFFLSKIGVTTVGTCVVPTDNSVEENQGTNAIFSNGNKANEVFPYSIAVYLAQSVHNHGAGTQGNLKLKSVNGTAPTSGTGTSTTINPAFPYSRSVYNVVRDNGTSTHVPTGLQKLLGSGSNTGYICTSSTAKSTILDYGFLTLGSNCGAVIKATS
jgi:ABC-type phosphate transport system substrate-binding protein